MTDTKPLNGKVILVTGAGSGIGRAIAIEAAKAGAGVVVNDLARCWTASVEAAPQPTTP